MAVFGDMSLLVAKMASNGGMDAGTVVTKAAVATGEIAADFFAGEKGTTGSSSLFETTFTSAVSIREHLRLSLLKRQTLGTTQNG